MKQGLENPYNSKYVLDHNLASVSLTNKHLLKYSGLGKVVVSYKTQWSLCECVCKPVSVVGG